jgi:hypothetical protein
MARWTILQSAVRQGWNDLKKGVHVALLLMAASEFDHDERLAVGVPDDITARHRVGVPGRGKAAR